MKEKLSRLLYFLRITDSDGLISLTHLTIFVSLYKVLSATTYSVTEVSTLLISMIAYGYKRHVQRNKAALSDENKTAIQKIEQKVTQLADRQSGIATAMGFKPGTPK